MHPKGASPLSCGENTNSYKELLKMKKILSILLAMVMIISSITVALIAIADEPAAITCADAIAKINEQTAYIANADNGDGTKHNLPGYSFGRSLTSDVTFGEGKAAVDAVMAACYPEYAEAPYHTESGYDYGKILSNLLGVSAVEPAVSVKKNSDAALTIGRDALQALKLDASKVKNFVANSSDSFTFTYDDIDIVADGRVEDSILADLTKNYPNATNLDNVIINSLSSHNTGLTAKDFKIKLTDIEIKAEFYEGRLDVLEYSYKLDGTASVTYIDPEPFDAVFSLTVKTTYNGMDYFDEENDFDLAVLAKKINEGTAYMVNTKAGYDYARLCTIDKTYNDEGQEIDDYSFSINSEGAIAGNTVLSVVLGAVFNVVDKITIGMDKNLGTNIRTDKWTCKNSTSEDEETKQDICTADKPHQIWQCTCKDVSGCCTCCPAGTGCTSTHPCDKDGACRSADCQCGYINDPQCKYESSAASNIEAIDSTVAKLLTELAKLLDKSIGAAAKDQMKVGATSANIAPADQKAAEKLDSRFAVKATQLDVFDIQEASFDETTGTIEFTLEDQNAGNGYKALSHLTNDYVTNEKFVEALKLAAIEKLGNTVKDLEGMFLYTSLEYSEITCTVKFVGATADNVYGTGEIERMNISYNCVADSEAMISYRIATHTDSTIKNAQYVDYEKGDVNMDTSVSLKDAKLVLRYVAELETLNDYQMLLADMNEDKVVNLVDARAILEKIANQTV